MKRGLFEASEGTRYIADASGVANMPRKAICKPNLELFSSEEGINRDVDVLQRINLSDLESGRTPKATSLEAPPYLVVKDGSREGGVVYQYP